MARAKRESDELYNARRRAKRALARLERDVRAGAAKRTRQLTAYQQELRKQIAETYIGAKPSEARVTQAKNAARTLDRYRIGAQAQKVERKNIMFRANIKAASAGSGTIPKVNVQVFWGATKHIWAGRGRDRYAALQRYFGTDDLQAIFHRVMAENKDALARAKGLTGAGTIADTADPLSALQQAMGDGVESDGNYPNDFMAFVVPVYNVE